MSNATELQERLARLRRIGLHKGVAHLQPRRQSSRSRERGPGIEEVVAGRVRETWLGTCFVAEETYPLSHRHGDLSLTAALNVTPNTAARLADLSDGASIDLRRAVFFDVETTGLSDGTGTVVFQVGTGFFEGDAFRVQQYFMRDLPEEPALARQPHRLVRVPHLDLLKPSRRLWHRRLESCALGSLEQNVLGVQRSEEEVPGWLIPRLYFEYIQTGDAGELAGVFYHNLVDILSMVTLTARLGMVFDDPQIAGSLDGVDLFSLGWWYERLGMMSRGEAAYRSALSKLLPADVEQSAWQRLSFLLKRQDRRGEAAVIWHRVAENGGTESLYAHVELAKYYEWYADDLPAATAVTRRAIALLESTSPNRRVREMLGELGHRLNRLERKMMQPRTME